MEIHSPDNAKAAIKPDRTTGSIATQSDIHYMSHRGEAWEATFIESGVAAAGVSIICWVVPASSEMAVIPEAAATQDITVVIKSITSITGGTPITPNNFKYGGDASPVSFVHSPSALGTESQVMGPRFLPSSGVGASRAILHEITEFHLPTGNYCMKITNNGASVATINSIINFYMENI